LHEQPQGYPFSQYRLRFHRWCRSDNGTTGQCRLLDQFVAILESSELTYVEALESQEEQQWIRADPIKPGLNPVLEDFARHYGVVVMPRGWVRHAA
jgi:hypothetical protein